jgi:hypothetical protein
VSRRIWRNTVGKSSNFTSTTSRAPHPDDHAGAQSDSQRNARSTSRKKSAAKIREKNGPITKNRIEALVKNGNDTNRIDTPHRKAMLIRRRVMTPVAGPE